MKYYKIIDNKQVFFKGNVLYTEHGTIFNPTEEQMVEAGWLVYQEPEPTDAEKLQAARAEKLMQIDNYDASPNVEQFTINGTPMWLNHEVRQQIKTSVEAYIVTGAQTVTKIFDGIEYTFPCETWLQMLATLEVYAAEALNTTERHKINVQNLTTVEEVRDYDYTINYPEKLNFGE